MKQKLTKLISAILVAFILLASSANVITYAADAYRTATELESQGTSTDNKNVKVDVYYAGGNHTKTIPLAETEERIYAKVTLTSGAYLDNAVIDFSSSNFVIANDESNGGKVQSVEDGKVALTRILPGDNAVEVKLKVSPKEGNTLASDAFMKDNTVRFTGTLVDKKEKQTPVTAEKIIHTSWQGEATSSITAKINKVIDYEVEESKKLLVEAELDTLVENSSLPVKQEVIKVNIPVIGEVEPEEVLVYAKTLEGINGDKEGLSFTSQNYTYNKSTKELEIKVNNLSDRISWVKGVQNQYEIVLIYPEINENKEFNLTANLNDTFYSAEEVYSNAAANIEETLSAKGTLVDYKAQIVEDEIAKGYMYANKIAAEADKKETTYTENYVVSTSYAKITDEIVINQNLDQDYVYNKSVKVNKDEFNKILGQEGKIEILANDEVVAIIDNSLEANSKNELEVSINKQIIGLKISKPQTEGKLNIEVEKAIAKEISHDISNLETLNLNTTAKVGDLNLVAGDTANLVEPTAKVGVSTNRNELSTLLENENVEIRVLLESDSSDDKLYVDPTITITLPDYIENLDLKDVQIVNSDELTIVDQSVSGNKTIVIKTEGKLTKYSDGNIYKGVEMLLTADITLEKLTPSTNYEIVAQVTDAKGISVSNSKEINYAAPTGLVATNEISNYAEGAQDILVISGEAEEAKLKVNSEARTVSVNKTIINNYSNSLDSMQILGRTFNKDNKNVLDGEDLGSTMSLPLTSGVAVIGLDSEDYTVYYSENAEATTDLTVSENEWTVQPANLAEVKSYLVTTNSNYTMEQGDSFEVLYNASIPANLTYNQASYENYAIYFNNNTATGAVADRTQGATLVLGTGTGPVLNNATTKITAELFNGTEIPNNGDVEEGQLVKYTVTVKNEGTTDITNLAWTINLPEQVESVIFREGYNSEVHKIGIKADEKTEIPGTRDVLKPEEEWKESFLVRIKSLTEISNTIINMQTSLTASELQEPWNLTHTSNAKAGTLAIEMTLIGGENNKLAEDDEATYYCMIRNLSAQEQNDVVFTFEVPEQIQYTETVARNGANIQYNESNRLVTVELGTLEAKKLAVIMVSGICAKAETVTNYNVRARASVTSAILSGNSINSNELSNIFIGADLLVGEQATNKDSGVITDKDSIEYYLTLRNDGVSPSIVTIEDELPEELDGTNYIIQSSVNYEEEEGDEIYNREYAVVSNNISRKLAIDAGEIVTLTIRADANPLPLGEVKEIENAISITTESGESVQIDNNPIRTIIEGTTVEEQQNNEENNEEQGNNNNNNEQSENGNNNNENNNNNQGNNENQNQVKETYRIAGIAWYDENSDGTRATKEDKISDIEVLLINADTNAQVQKVKTNTNGAYSFTNLEKGNYIVIALYDTNKYALTQYKAAKVSQNSNSDFTSNTVQLEGKTLQAAITDKIAITDANIYNIDLGLIDLPKFDLKLDKKVSKITSQTSKGLTEYIYNKNFAKLDFDAKTINNTTMIVEYKITVTNEGNVPGYAKKIADYIPSGMSFISELNSNWYASNGTAYNVSLANTVLKPGESKEVTLILTRKMSDEALGTISNSAEITEINNDLGIADTDSTPGNKKSAEDDYSEAIIVASVKTGQVYIYTGLIVAIIAIVSTGTYLIKKKVLA